MPRIRTVKPDFWTDEKIGRLKREERLLFIGLWNLADDQGVIKNSSAYIKGQLFSYDDDLRTQTIDSWLASLINARMLVPFRFEAEGYLCIRTFNEHQLINRPSKEKFSKELMSDVKNTHGVLTEYSQQEGKGKEGKGKEGKDPPEIIFPFLSEEFGLLWKNWKNYKKNEFKKNYKTSESEQAALSNLCKLARGDEATAKEIIMQSIANQWQGLFELKTNNNEQSGSSNRKPHPGKITGEQLNKAYAKFYNR